MASAQVLAPPVYEVRVAGAVVTPLFSSFKISETLDAPDTLLADLASVAAPYLRPSVGQSVIVTENGARIFGGTVTGVRERGLIGASASKIVVEVQASSFEINADRRLITRAFNASAATETIGSAFAALVADYYAAVGVTLHPAQAAGPVLPAATFERVSGAAVNKQLAASVGYLQSIDFDNRLRAWAPGDVLAPANYDELVNPGLLTGDIAVERGQLQSGYANRVILTGDPIAVPDFREHYVGDGVRNVWPVTYKVVGPYTTLVDGAIGFGIVFYPAAGGTTESIGGVASPMLWKYDPIAMTITRSAGPVAAGVAFEFPYHGLFVPEGMAEDAAEIAQYGLWEHIEEVTAVLTDVSAQAYADAVLAAKLAGKEEIITLATRALGFHPGQLMGVESPSRALTGDYLITQVETVTDAGGLLLLRTITASKSLNNNHDWRRVYQQWAGASAGGSSSSTGAIAVGGGLHAATHKAGGMDPLPIATLPDWSTWFNQVLKTTDSPTFANLGVTGGAKIGGTGTARNVLHVGVPSEAVALPSYAGLTVQAVAPGAIVSARYCSGGASSVEGGFFAHQNNNVYLGAWTNSALVFRTSNADRMTLNAAGTSLTFPGGTIYPLTVDASSSVVARDMVWAQQRLYVQGFRVTVTADCTIPSSGGGGATLPPTLAYYDASNPWSAYQSFQGLSFHGHDLDSWLDQDVRTTASPHFDFPTVNNLTVAAGITANTINAPSYFAGGSAGITMTARVQMGSGLPDHTLTFKGGICIQWQA